MDFKGFSPDSFEQFIRALALKVVGPGVTIFGNGPDGGREATFHGKVNYPHPPENTWDGYGVIQAKFKEKAEGTRKDQAWAAAQLSAELTKWQENAKRNPKPDYFIYCTNVELSSAIGGGRAAIEKVFEDHKAALGFKAYAIWDANQLKGYVDGHEEIRKRFSCFFTTGDLLSEFAKSLASVADPEVILHAYLCKEVLADEDARLSQAGDRSEDRIRLANVFMDLPVSNTRVTELPEENAKDDSHAVSLHELLRVASHKLDPLALYEGNETQGQRLHGRFLFLGGPGSGKSTIGQFFSQIHRAALLDRRPKHRLEPKVRNVIQEIKSRCVVDGVIWPSTPRYPFRIELNAFAKALAAGQKDGALSLSEYLRQKLSRDFALTHEDLRDWLRVFPWLLILDGLDEVPSSSNRREVVAAIQNFLNEASDVEADLMIVASSRPDGYAGEFDGDEVAYRYLLPLSKPRALVCAQRYVNAKVAAKGEQRAAEAMSILKSAIENPLVARLMRSPLQVTFMVTVVAASGKPSESRWQLFSDYYRTIYERELHKAVPPFDKALNERRQDIDALHHRVGFILQCRAESSGGTQADLSMAEFEQLVCECLEENGLSAEDLENQKEMILGAANQRLVFLTSRTPGRLSFEVRSLQEYMAAACITNADSEVIFQRLDFIVHSAYWRNTLLFAVGRFFVESQMRGYRDKIRSLCEDLNRKDQNRAAAKLGSRVALEILESGTTGNVPLFNRSLATCALELLADALGSDDVLKRLADIYLSFMEIEFRQALSLWLGQKEVARSLFAWMLTLHLEKKGIAWAKEMAVEKWPEQTEDAKIILSAWLSTKVPDEGNNIELDELDADRVNQLIPQISVKEFNALFRYAIKLDNNESSWLPALTRWWASEPDFYIKLLDDDKHPFSLEVQINAVASDMTAGMFHSIKTLCADEHLHADWMVLDVIADYFIEPSAARVSNILEYMANNLEPEDWIFWATKLPWPIAACLKSELSKSALLELAKQFQSGRFGDIAIWTIKESAWQTFGIDLDEFFGALFQDEQTLVGAINGMRVSSDLPKVAESMTIVLSKYLINIQQHAAKRELAWMLSFYAEYNRTMHCLDLSTLKANLHQSRKQWWSFDLIINPKEITDPKAWVDFYDYFGRMNELRCNTGSFKADEFPVDFVLNAFIEDPSRLGLLRLLGFWCVAGRRVEARVHALDSLDRFSDSRFRLAAMLVRMTQHGLSSDDAAQIAAHVPAVIANDGEPQALRVLVSFIERHAKENPELEIILTELIKVIPSAEWQVRTRAEALRNTFLEAHPGGFNIRRLVELKLPFITN